MTKTKTVLAFTMVASCFLLAPTSASAEWAWNRPLNKKPGHAFYTSNRNHNNLRPARLQRSRYNSTPSYYGGVRYRSSSNYGTSAHPYSRRSGFRRVFGR